MFWFKLRLERRQRLETMVRKRRKTWFVAMEVGIHGLGRLKMMMNTVIRGGFDGRGYRGDEVKRHMEVVAEMETRLF